MKSCIIQIHLRSWHVLFMVWFGAWSIDGSSQSAPTATESSRLVDQISSQLVLPSELQAVLMAAALPWDACVTHWQFKVDSLERAPISEDALLAQIVEARQEIGSCREQRKAAMRAVLPPSFQVKFDDLAQPSRPSVLHFGIHNRLDCNVCKPQSPESP